MNFKALIMEALGVFALCYIGGQSIVMPKNGNAVDMVGPGVAIAHMLALGIMIYIGAATSGANFNPAVSLALMITGKLPLMDAIFYMIAQLLGGFLGGVMIQVLNPARPGYCYRASFPATMKDHAGVGMIMEFFATFFLVFMVFATAVDKRAPPSIYGFAIGGTVLMSALGMGAITGGSLNPTRYLGPWIPSIWADNANCPDVGSGLDMVVYLVASPLGGIAGGVLYNFVFLEA